MEANIILVAILVVAVLGRANSVAVAACILLLLKLTNLSRYVYPVVEKNGVTWGLIILIAAILIPIADGSVAPGDIRNIFTSWVGVAALLLSLLTTYLSGLGANYLTVQGHSELMAALIMGAVIAATFLGGVPVGPFITSGIVAFLVKILDK